MTANKGASGKKQEKRIENQSAFDTIMEDILRYETDDWMLQECMTFNAERLKKIPQRYRIIALGFVRHYSIDQLNDTLKKSGCAQLYSRSVWEASLIYAFIRGMSYDEWKELQPICASFLEEKSIENSFFSTSISVENLEHYIKESSTLFEDLIFRTRHLTRMMEEKIEKVAPGEKGFRQFLSDNAEQFSLVREKTRYYFCKYLYYMLITRIDHYVEDLQKGRNVRDDISDLMVFKGITALKRKKMTPEECRQLLRKSPISCGTLFDEFNYFFFEYVSLDWMQVILDYYGNLDDMAESAKASLAEHLRKYDKTKYADPDDDKVVELLKEELEKEEEELDRLYSLDARNAKTLRSRAGENTIRKFIKGELDIDRTSLVCFLLFFGNNADLYNENVITQKRLSDILLECGFPGLRPEDGFDRFVIEYINAPDPSEYLIQEVTELAMLEENSYLYRVYKGAKSYNEEFEKLLIKNKKI